MDGALEGSLPLALAVAVAFLGGFLFETRFLLRRRSDWYFLPGFPLRPPLVPIPRVPEGSGRTTTVRWERSAPNLVRFWADPSDRVGLAGLHGVVVLAQGRRGIELELRWAPPWTPMFAALWLAGLGLVRGEGPLTVTIGVVICGGMLLVYAERARRAAAELRWSFLQGGDPSTPPPEG